MITRGHSNPVYHHFHLVGGASDEDARGTGSLTIQFAMAGAIFLAWFNVNLNMDI